jgi:hypothetical protein
LALTVIASIDEVIPSQGRRKSSVAISDNGKSQFSNHEIASSLRFSQRQKRIVIAGKAKKFVPRLYVYLSKRQYNYFSIYQCS